jgi:hypothetical protein
MFGNIRYAQALQLAGDTLLTYFALLNRMAVVVNSLQPDSFRIDRVYPLTDSLAGDFYLLPERTDSFSVLVTEGITNMELFKISDSGEAEAASLWSFPGRITASTSVDTLVAVVLSKQQIWLNRITEEFGQNTLGIVDLTAPAFELAECHGRLLAFVGKSVTVYDLSSPTDPVRDTIIEIPLTVLSSARHGNELWLVGPEGVGLLDCSDSLPRFIGLAGKPGRYITVDSRAVVTSDGGSVLVYYRFDTPDPEPILPEHYILRQNYPNPFNGTTVIRFDLVQSAPTRLVIYNILGQRVRTLIDSELSPGEYIVRWDGTDDRGTEVATGVYLYRLISGDAVSTKKMLLLK